MAKKRKSFKRLISIFTVLMLSCTLIFTGVMTVSATDGENTETSLALYKNNPEEALPFSVTNMLPGDEVIGTYNLDVSYKGTITVHFGAEILPGYEKLAEVLKCKVLLDEAEAPLYDGLMKDMPESIDTEITSQEKTTQTLVYDIIVYLDTSVGNDYQNKQLVCNFSWWVATEGVTNPSESTDPTEYPFGPTDDPFGPTDDPFGPTDDPFGPTDDPFGPTDDPFGPTDDPFGPTDDPFGPTEDETLLPVDPTDPTQSTTESTTRKNPPDGELIDPPYTGDSTQIGVFIAVVAISSVAFVLSLRRRKEEAYV